MTIYKGTCICESVNYQFEAEKPYVVNCHCNFCRSHTGTAFSTYAVFPHAALEITKGESKINSYKAGEGIKHFCTECGTPIFNLNNLHPGACIVYFGTLKAAKELKPNINIWCESKLAWINEISSIKSVQKGLEK